MRSKFHLPIDPNDHEDWRKRMWENFKEDFWILLAMAVAFAVSIYGLK